MNKIKKEMDIFEDTLNQYRELHPNDNISLAHLYATVAKYFALEAIKVIPNGGVWDEMNDLICNDIYNALRKQIYSIKSKNNSLH